MNITTHNHRYIVVMNSGRKFVVEEWDNNHNEWGDIDPATKKLHKVNTKDDEVLNESNTEITKENGFKNIVELQPGTSALGYIEAIDGSGLQRFEKLDCGKYLD